MCIGRLNKFCVTFKINECRFSMFRRKYQHNLRVKVHDEDYDGSKALEVHSLNVFFVSKIDKIHVYDLTSLEYKGQIDIELMK